MFTPKFGEFLNVFVIDGTGIPCDTLMERVAALQKPLAKETEEITILTRITTNTVRAVTSHTNKISALSASLEPGVRTNTKGENWEKDLSGMLRSVH